MHTSKNNILLRIFLLTLFFGVLFVSFAHEASAVTLVESSYTHCDPGGPWGFILKNSYCPADTYSVAGNCPAGSFTFYAGGIPLGCYYLGSSQNTVYNKCWDFPHDQNDECCFAMCQYNALTIGNVVVKPAVNINNNGSAQKVNVTFESSRYPIYYSFILFNSSNAIKNKVSNSITAPKTLSYTIPANLTAGIYKLYINLTDNYGYNNYRLISTINVTYPQLVPPPRSDTTPPRAITDLRTSGITNSTINWTWTNPTNADFSRALVYLNGVYTALVNGNSYTASNLQANTLYNLSIRTKDVDENVNTTFVSNIARTLSNPLIVPPRLTIVSPANNAVYNSTQILVNISTINATQVRFSTTGITDRIYTEPVYITLQNGTHILSAIASNSAYDVFTNIGFTVSLGSGNQTNQTCSINCNNTNETSGFTTFPVLSIISPANVTYTTPLVVINLSAINATSLQYKLFNGALQDYTGPVEINLFDGSYNITAVATNNIGSVSQAVTFSVNTAGGNDETNQTDEFTSPPILSIVSPLNITYNSSLIIINLSAINATEVRFSTTGISDQIYTDPVSINLENGSHMLTAVATNNIGSVSQAVTFSVLTLPGNGNNGTMPGNQTCTINCNNTNTTNPENNTNGTNPIFSSEHKNRGGGISRLINYFSDANQNKPKIAVYDYDDGNRIEISGKKASKKIDAGLINLILLALTILLALLLLFLVISRRNRIVNRHKMQAR